MDQISSRERKREGGKKQEMYLQPYHPPTPAPAQIMMSSLCKKLHLCHRSLVMTGDDAEGNVTGRTEGPATMRREWTVTGLSRPATTRWGTNSAEAGSGESFRRRGSEKVSVPAQRDDHRPGSDEDDEEGMRVDGKLGMG